jgi:hypothetical protein
MSEDKSPDWYDESKAVRAIYALENGYPAYGGWVIDLGDGTCRFSNDPLLGEVGPKWGDRVDLFYNPCDPFSRPMIGYRIYADGEEPTGRSFGLKLDPTPEEQAEWDEKQERWEKAEDEKQSKHFEAMDAPLRIIEAEHKASGEVMRYEELLMFVKEQGVEVPEDLHEKKRESKPEPTLEERRDTKLFLLAEAQRSYGDIEIDHEEVVAEAKKMDSQDKQAEAFVKAFDDHEQSIADAT